MKTIFLLTALVATASAESLAQLPPPITIIATGHPVAAKGQTIAYSGECNNEKYEMRISRETDKVQFFLRQGKQVVDVSNSNFGQTFLTMPLAGVFAFTCVKDVLQANFWGVEIPVSGPSRSIVYLFELGFDGTIVNDQGMKETDQSSVINVLTREYYRNRSDRR
jgi:hypothetical protein